MTRDNRRTTQLSFSLEDIDIVGDTGAQDGESTRLFVFYTGTQTERSVLEHYAEASLANAGNAPAQAWVQDIRDGDSLFHDGLIDGLDGPDNLLIIPVGVAWKPKSQKQQSWRQIMGWTHLIGSDFRQRRILKTRPERCAVIVGEAATLGDLRRRHEKHAAHDETAGDGAHGLADYIALQAALTIERDARSVTGETIKYPRYVTRALWGRKSFQAQLENIATESGRPIADIREEARACLKELVPNARAPHISAAWAFSRAVCRLGYEDKLIYDKQKVAEIRRMALSRPLALVFTHKTHIDGVAMMLATRDESFPLVHMIGGDNMAFAGVGYLMRRAGAIFIRRTIDSPVYKVVMRQYLSYLMEKRFPVSWALEGTRSRNGKLMPPRFGILKYVVEAAAKENMRDLTIIPVSIYYDLIAELSDYAVEQTGATKRKESLAWMADYLRSLRKPLGRISFAFGEPVIVDTTSADIASAIAAGDDSFSVHLQKLAFEASASANAVTPLTPTALFMLILTGAAPRALTETEINERMLALRDWAKSRALPITKDIRKLDVERMRAVADGIIEMGVVACYDGGPEPVYSIAPDKHFDASYYRNTAIHFFVTKAIAELALVKAAHATTDRVEAFWREAAELRDLFKFEFFYPPLVQFKADIEEELRRYDPEWMDRVNAGEARDLLTDMTPLVSHAALRPFAEAYSIVADVILDTSIAGGATDKKAVVNAALNYARQALLQRRIASEESIGKLMFENGFDLAAHRNIIDGDAAALSAARRNFRDQLDDITKRIDLVASIAEARHPIEPEKGAPAYPNGSARATDATPKH